MLRKIFLLLFVLFSSFNVSYAVSSLDIVKNHEYSYDKELFVWEVIDFDLTELKKEISENSPEKEVIFEWTYLWETKEFEKFSVNASATGTFEITLKIYLKEKDSDIRDLIEDKNFPYFVYDKSIPVIVSDKIDDLSINNFKTSYSLYWINVNIISKSSLDSLPVTSILTSLDDYKWWEEQKSNYLIIWWDKDFSFNVISKLNSEIASKNSEEKLNILILSTFNIDVISSYLNNFLQNKDWITNIIIANDQSRLKIADNPLLLANVETSLKDWAFPFVNVNLKWDWISNLMFISKFINNFSNLWFDVDSIYIIILIPFVLTYLSFAKHLVWFSTIWIIVPTFLIIFAIKVWIILALAILASMIILNLVFIKYLSRYNLLYTPKISLLIILNIVLFIVIINTIIFYNILEINLTDTVYIILLIIISERLISLLVSKEFVEYRLALFNTIWVFLVWFFIFSIPTLKVLLLAFPETILVLIPLNYLIWRFTWLRVTEYFRFRELIKNIEE